MVADSCTAPGPPPTPWLGVVPHLLRFGRDSIGTAGRLFEQYGPLASIVRAPARFMSPGGKFVVVANGAALNREILISTSATRRARSPAPITRIAKTWPARATAAARAAAPP